MPIRALTLAALVLVAVVEVFPYVWMVSTSLKDMAGVTRFPPTLWPSEPQWQNYAKAWASGPFLRYAVNNAIQTLGILVCQLFFGCLAGFAFSKLRWRGRAIVLHRELILAGVIGIVEGLNPKLIRAKLEAFTDPEGTKPAKPGAKRNVTPAAAAAEAAAGQ